MNLEPAVQQFVDANAGQLMDHLEVAEQRRYMRLLIDLNFLRFSQRGPEVYSVRTHTITVDGGHVRVRVYRPSDEPDLPAYLALHGGGWWQGSIDDLISDALCRQRCVEAHVVVLALDYRLAPEHPFPTGLFDAHATYRWAVDSARQIGIDPSNISVGGSSAGGNLSAALALKLRNEPIPKPVLQLLEVPALDLTLQTARQTVAGAGAQLHEELNVAVARYLPDQADAHNQLASPLHAADLGGLPPTVIFTAEHDPLRGDGERYGARLREAGVPVEIVAHRGALHGSAMLTRTWAPAATWQREVSDALRAAHWRQADVAAS